MRERELPEGAQKVLHQDVGGRISRWGAPSVYTGAPRNGALPENMILGEPGKNQVHSYRLVDSRGR